MLNFLNRNLENAQIKLADIEAIYRRLKLHSKLISYVELLNALFYAAEKQADPETVKMQLIKHM